MIQLTADEVAKMTPAQLETKLSRILEEAGVRDEEALMDDPEYVANAKERAYSHSDR